MAELCFQPASLLARQWRRAPRRRTGALLIGRFSRPWRRAYEFVGIFDRDRRHEISFHPRRVRSRHLGRLGGGRLTDEQASALAEALEARKREVRGIDTVANRAPQVAALREGGGAPEPLPAQAEGGALARSAGFDRAAPDSRGVRSDAAPPRQPVHDGGARRPAHRRRRDARSWRLFLTLGEIAARAGVCVTTARNALRTAAREGLVTIEERRRDKRPNLANVVRVVSREWKTWIERSVKRNAQARGGSAERGGCKKAGATDKGSSRTLHGDRVSRGQLSKNALLETPNGVSLRT